MPTGRQKQRNPNQTPASANTSGNTPPPDPLDVRIVAKPTPLTAAAVPGSETFSHLAQQEFDDMETSLGQVVTDLKQIHDNGPHAGNRYIGPEGPGMDMLNALALIAHQRKPSGPRGAGAYTRRDTPSATMAQEIITAFPNPKDAALAVAAHLDAVARLNHKAGVTLDMAHEISNLEALLTVIYGDRFAEFKVVEQERMQAEQQQQQEQAQQQAEAARRAQLEQDVTFDGRELLLTKHRRSLDRTKSRVVARNLRDVRRAEQKNDRTLNRNERFAKRAANARNRANARRQRRDRSTWLTRWAWKRLANRADKRATKRETRYNADTALRASRITEAAAASLSRSEHYSTTVKRLSERRVEQIVHDHALRKLRMQEKRRELIRQGVRATEARRRASILDANDELQIKATAMRIARRQARRSGYLPTLDGDRN
ncbi:MAG TPA: hypothetical protein PKV96_00510 [Candidatus Saccharimonas sp.]|nr:hypothetical protein [Candidatus Saccharimonas sp.]